MLGLAACYTKLVTENENIFTKIIRGEIPSHKIYEDDTTFAFLDIHPKQPGHVLVIPKQEVEYVWDLTNEDYQKLMETVRKVGLRIQEVLEPVRVGVQIEGTGVQHAHVHVFPFETVAQFIKVPDQSAEPDHADLAAMAQRLAF